MTTRGCVSATAFLVHPLLARLRLGSSHQPVEWDCNERIVNEAKTEYQISNRPRLIHAEDTLLMYSDWVLLATDSRRKVLDCLELLRTRVVDKFCAVVDTASKTLHHVDLVAERDGMACLVLIFYTHSPISAPKDRVKVAEHGARLRRICKEQYGMTVCSTAINVYRDGVGGVQVKALRNRPPHPHSLPLHTRQPFLLFRQDDVSRAE